MTRLPRGVSGQDCVKALEKAGFFVQRQKSSHIQMKRINPKGRVTVPNHRQLKLGTLRAIIRQAGLTVTEFADLLK